MIRKARTDHGRSPETGVRVGGRAEIEANDKEYAIYLYAHEFSERKIQEITGVPKTTLRRLVGRSA
jgi:hypothetical protein